MISTWQCAWCEPPKDTGSPGAGRVNYGICAACLKRCLSETYRPRHGVENRRDGARTASPALRP